MKSVGIIVAGSAYPMDGFKLGLRDLGWIEDEGIRFELRAAEGQLHLLPKFALEMVSLGVDLIAVIGAVTVRAVSLSHLDDSHCVCGRCRADRRRISVQLKAPRRERHGSNHL